MSFAPIEIKYCHNSDYYENYCPIEFDNVIIKYNKPKNNQDNSNNLKLATYYKKSIEKIYYSFTHKQTKTIQILGRAIRLSDHKSLSKLISDIPDIPYISYIDKPFPQYKNSKYKQIIFIPPLTSCENKYYDKYLFDYDDEYSNSFQLLYALIIQFKKNNEFNVNKKNKCKNMFTLTYNK